MTNRGPVGRTRTSALTVQRDPSVQTRANTLTVQATKPADGLFTKKVENSETCEVITSVLQPQPPTQQFETEMYFSNSKQCNWKVLAAELTDEDNDVSPATKQKEDESVDPGILKETTAKPVQVAKDTIESKT